MKRRYTEADARANAVTGALLVLLCAGLMALVVPGVAYQLALAIGSVIAALYAFWLLLATFAFLGLLFVGLVFAVLWVVKVYSDLKVQDRNEDDEDEEAPPAGSGTALTGNGDAAAGTTVPVAPDNQPPSASPSQTGAELPHPAAPEGQPAARQ